MRDFDATIRSAPGVFRYYRFADDIIALTTSRPDELSALMDASLPKPMEFHRNKTKRSDEALPGKSSGPHQPVTLEYLGYRFEVTQTSKKRDSRELRVSFQSVKSENLSRESCSRLAPTQRHPIGRPSWIE